MILYILILSMFAVVLNLTLPLIAGLYIVDDLGGSIYTSSYAVSFFCIGNMITVPLGKPRSTSLSPIHLYLTCLSCMIIFSWLCAISTDYFHFLVFRFFEGIVSGPLYLLITNKLIPDFVTDKEKHFVSSLLMLCFALGPVLAASWGGWIAFYHNWRMMFFSHIGYCLFFVLFFGYYRKNFYENKEEAQFDWLGFFFYAIAAFCLGTVLTIGQELDWFRSTLICFLFVIGSLSALFFFTQSARAKYPIIEFKLLKNTYFALAMVNVCLLFAIYFGTLALLSLWLRLFVNYSASWILLSIGVTLIGAWVPILINYKSYNPRVPLAMALIFLFLSSWYSTAFNVDIDFFRIAISRIFAGAGLVLFLAPLFNLALETFPKNMASECLNFFHIVRLWGCGIGVALFIILWHRRQIFYYKRLGSRLSDFSMLTDQFFVKAHQFYLTEKQAAGKLSDYLNRQATALALADCFYLISWILIFLILFLLVLSLFRSPKLLSKPNN